MHQTARLVYQCVRVRPAASEVLLVLHCRSRLARTRFRGLLESRDPLLLSEEESPLFPSHDLVQSSKLIIVVIDPRDPIPKDRCYSLDPFCGIDKPPLSLSSPVHHSHCWTLHTFGCSTPPSSALFRVIKQSCLLLSASRAVLLPTFINYLRRRTESPEVQPRHGTRGSSVIAIPHSIPERHRVRLAALRIAQSI